MLRLSQIKIRYDEEYKLSKKIERLLGTKDFTIKRIVKKSLDARKKDNIVYIYTVDVECKNEDRILNKNSNNNNIMSTYDKKYQFPYKNSSDNVESPVIVGAGPAGYFCGLFLARAGYNPVILERGKDVYERAADVRSFWDGGTINSNSNVSFGEGGAGTFSDGKLNTGIKDKEGRIKAVIDNFILFGAPEDISYISKPHIGTDYLMDVMKNMREEIISLGGRVLFNTCFENYSKNGDFITVKAHDYKSDKELSFITKALVLAIGHSSRDTFEMLNKNKLYMEPKAFAIGVRVEHPAAVINEAQYGTAADMSKLPAADYKMTYRSSNERSVYSFCMCPGGFVVNASSGPEQSVVNGMSNHKRDEANSNSAIVVNVTPDDFIAEGYGEYGVLAGVRFQENYEKRAYDEGKGSIPVQLFGDYKAGKITEKLGRVLPNIKGRYTFGNLNNCLPPYVNNAIIEGIEYYGKKLKDFDASDTVLAGIETRTSSPVRLKRGDDFMSINETGVFPCGEGAGYAGGITSAAVDGIKVAEAVAAYLQ